MKCCLQISSKNYNDQVKDKGFDSLAVTRAWGGCHGPVMRGRRRKHKAFESLMVTRVRSAWHGLVLSEDKSTT